MIKFSFVGKICDVCGEGEVTEIIEFSRDYSLTFNRCDTCGADYATPDQTKKNKEVYMKSIHYRPRCSLVTSLKDK